MDLPFDEEFPDDTDVDQGVNPTEPTGTDDLDDYDDSDEGDD